MPPGSCGMFPTPWSSCAEAGPYRAHMTLPTVSRSGLNAPMTAAASPAHRPHGPRASSLNTICPFYGDKADLSHL